MNPSQLIPVLNNPLFGGGLLLMVTGGIMASFRKVPHTIWEWIKSQCMITVNVTNSDPVFEWLTLWLNQHPYSKKSRRLSASTEKPKNSWEYDEDEGVLQEAPKIIFSPSPGDHFLRYKKKFMWLNRERKEPTQGGSGSAFVLRPEEYWITVFGRNQQSIRDLLNDVVAAALASTEKKEAVFTSTGTWWSKIKNYIPRPMESVILPGNTSEDIIADIKEFIKKKEWYENKGIPYHRGYLFYGIPGSGKTSLIAALAHELHINLYTLNLGGKDINDDSLIKLMLDVPAGSMILFEDIDGVAPERGKDKKQEKDKVSLTCLLNCLDGLLANTGILVFMTSNHPDRLDGALIRPGRVDVKKEFGYVEPDQIDKLFRRFYDAVTEEQIARAVKAIGKKKTMAELQMVLLVNKDSAEKAIEALNVEPEKKTKRKP